MRRSLGIRQFPMFVNLPLQNNVRYARLVSLDLFCGIILAYIWIILIVFMDLIVV